MVYKCTQNLKLSVYRFIFSYIIIPGILYRGTGHSLTGYRRVVIDAGGDPAGTGIAPERSAAHALTNVIQINTTTAAGVFFMPILSRAVRNHTLYDLKGAGAGAGTKRGSTRIDCSTHAQGVYLLLKR
jgi:hypothetical protein